MTCTPGESCRCAGIEVECTFDCPRNPDDIIFDPAKSNVIRTFDTGATRDTDEGKLNYRRFFSSLVLERRAQYMEKHRFQSNGELRAPDNWKNGIPLEAYADSEWRHHWELWNLIESGVTSGDAVEETICALMFNLEGYLYELLK